VVVTKRSLDFLLKALVAAAFVVCVEWFARRRARRKPLPAPPARGRVRIRRESQTARVIFSIEGSLDELGARLLASSVAMVPSSMVAVIDLDAAEPIRGGSLSIFARVFAAGRRVSLRGLREHHTGLLALSGRHSMQLAA